MLAASFLCSTPFFFSNGKARWTALGLLPGDMPGAVAGESGSPACHCLWFLLLLHPPLHGGRGVPWARAGRRGEKAPSLQPSPVRQPRRGLRGARLVRALRAREKGAKNDR